MEIVHLYDNFNICFILYMLVSPPFSNFNTGTLNHSFLFFFAWKEKEYNGEKSLR